MWQMCGYLPTTLPKLDNEKSERLSLMTAKLTASFVLETLIHSKEKVLKSRNINSVFQIAILNIGKEIDIRDIYCLQR